MLSTPPIRAEKSSYGIPILAIAAAAAIVYATLHPFSGWRPWSSLSVIGLSYLFDPWPRYWTGVDLASNVAMYLPFAALLATLLSDRVGRAWALPLCVALCAAMSLSLETMQILLPARVPSKLDWIANTTGALLGAGIALAIAPIRVRRWAAENRRRLPFTEGTLPGVAILLAWIVAQAEPQAMSFATGQLFDGLLRHPSLISHATRLQGFLLAQAPLAEGVAVFLTTLAIGGLLREVLRPDVHWLRFALVWVLLAAAVKTAASWLLLESRAPLGWLNAASQGGLFMAIFALTAMSWLDRANSLRLACLALVLATLIFNLTPASDYHRATLAAWRVGHWANFAKLIHGMSLYWPYLAMLYILTRRRFRARARL